VALMNTISLIYIDARSHANPYRHLGLIVRRPSCRSDRRSVAGPLIERRRHKHAPEVVRPYPSPT
jgi:hypothetical protein